MERLVPEQAVGGDQQRRFVFLPVQSAVQFGEEEVDHIWCFLLDGVKLKHLQMETSGRVSGNYWLDVEQKQILPKFLFTFL